MDKEEFCNLAAVHNVSELARRYGVDRKTIRSWLQKFGLKNCYVAKPTLRSLIQKADVVQAYAIIRDDLRKVGIATTEVAEYLHIETAKLMVMVAPMRENLRIDLIRQQYEDNGWQTAIFWESEWVARQSLCQAMIRTRLGLNQKLMARDLTVMEPDSRTEFMANNHLHGDRAATKRLALVLDGEIQQMVTFKSCFVHNCNFEMARFATKAGVTVVGGLSRLLHHCQAETSQGLLSYADRRFSSGFGYARTGFESLGNTGPGYFYYHPDEKILRSRQEFQKHKLGSKLAHFDPNLSERENLRQNGYLRIEDAGHQIWRLPRRSD